ncbi:MAG: molybdopterin biosynthesis protein [Candidatus Odinarchaeia archaeon]
MTRKIFRTLKSVDEVWEIIRDNYPLKPRKELVAVDAALGRTIFEDVYSPSDVPGFDRSAMDGFAVVASDTFGADEVNPITLKVIGKIEAGDKPSFFINKGECVEISTGAPIPKGANAVVMVEYTEKRGDYVNIYKPIVAGGNIQSTGSDIMRGEVILRKNQVITSREIGVACATGLTKLPVYYQPKIGVISTGNEIIPIGSSWEYGKVYDINAHTIMAAIRESGGVSTYLGILKDNKQQIKKTLQNAIGRFDLILTSGSTSAGIGDVMYNLFNELGEPGVLVHGIAVKPGKPTVIALIENTLIIGLPGYPTSALSIFNLFVRPIIMKLGGKQSSTPETLTASISQKIIRAQRRRELLPVNIVKTSRGFSAYPVLKGSGAITTLAEADGYIEIPEHKTILDEGENVEVHLYPNVKPANLMFIGSHCIGVDLLFNLIQEEDEHIKPKIINVGSLGGIHAIKRGEADIAGIHILDENSGEYNTPIYLGENLRDVSVLIKGYRRMQGLLLPKNNPHNVKTLRDIINKKLYLINRNKGSGTRILMDILLKKIAQEMNINFSELIEKIPGYMSEAKTHSAVAVAVKYGKADVGLGIETMAKFYDLEFIPIQEESYDFLVLKERLDKPEIKKFLEFLTKPEFKSKLETTLAGYTVTDETGKIV